MRPGRHHRQTRDAERLCKWRCHSENPRAQVAIEIACGVHLGAARHGFAVCTPMWLRHHHSLIAFTSESAPPAETHRKGENEHDHGEAAKQNRYLQHAINGRVRSEGQSGYKQALCNGACRPETAPSADRGAIWLSEPLSCADRPNAPRWAPSRSRQPEPIATQTAGVRHAGRP